MRECNIQQKKVDMRRAEFAGKRFQRIQKPHCRARGLVVEKFKTLK